MSNRRNFIKKVSLAAFVSSIIPKIISAEPNSMTEQLRAKSRRALRIAHITDIHLQQQPLTETCFMRVLRELNTMQDKPDLIINTGDTLMDENRKTQEIVQAGWDSWNKIIKAENKLEIKSALGNHDVWYGPDEELDAIYKSDKRYGKGWAMEMLSMPERYYAFEKKGWHFIALDSINGTDGYQLDEEQFEWLKEQLGKIPSTSPVCIFCHVPILSMGAMLYDTQRKSIKDVKFPSADMHNDHQRIKNLFFKHKNVKVCLSGHVHYIDAIEYLGVKYLCNGAVSGNWWRDPLSLDEFPPVYTLIDFFDDGTVIHQHIYYNTAI